MVDEYISTVPIQPQRGVVSDVGVQAVSKISDSLLQEAEKSAISKAQEAGAVAGNQIDFKPVTGGAAARAYNQAALESNRYYLAANVADNTNRIYAETSQIPDAEQAHLSFLAKFKGFSDGLLQNVPDQNQPYIRNILAHAQESAELKILSRVNKARITQGYLAGMNTIDSYINQMHNAASNGDRQGALTFHGDASNELSLLVNSGSIDKKAAEIVQRNITNNLNEGYYIGQYRLAKQQDELKGTNSAETWKQKFIESKQVGNVLSDTQKKRVLNTIDFYDKQEAAAHGITAQNYSDRLKDIVFKATQTGEKPTNEELIFLRSAQPDKYEDAQQQITNGLTAHSIALAPQTLGDMTATVSKLNAETPKDINQSKIKTTAISLLKTKMKQLVDDPVSVSQNDTIYKKMIDNPVMQNAYKDDPNRIRLLWENKIGLQPDKWQVQTAAQNQEDISNLHTLLNSDDPKMGIDQAMNFLQQKRLQFPSTFHVYMQGITGKAGVPKFLETLVDMSQNPKSSVYLNDAIAAFSEKPSEITKNLQKGVASNVSAELYKNDAISDFHNTMTNYSTTDTKQSDEMLQNVKHLALWYIQNRNLSETNAVKQSFDVLYGNNYNYIGNDYRVRNTEDPAKVRQMMNYVDNNLQQYHLPPLGTSKGDLDLPYLTRFTMHYGYQTGHWINDPSNDENFIRVDVNGAPIRTPAGFKLFGEQINRSYLMITKDDLENPDFHVHAEEQRQKLIKSLAKPQTVSALFATRQKLHDLYNIY